MPSDRQYKEKAAEVIRRANDAVYQALCAVPDSTIEHELRPELQRVKGSGAFVSAWVFVSDKDLEVPAPPKDLLAEGRADNDATGTK